LENAELEAKLKQALEQDGIGEQSNAADSSSSAATIRKPEGMLTSTEFLVEEFLRARKIDKIAADALRRCKREVQLAVVARGPFGLVSNVSTALFQRIREMEATPLDSSKYVNEDQCVSFCKKWGLDPDAQARIMCCSPDVQQILMKEFNPTPEMIKEGANKKFMLFASSLHTAEVTGRFSPRAVLANGMKTAEFFQFGFLNTDSNVTTPPSAALKTISGGSKWDIVEEPQSAGGGESEFDAAKVEDFIASNGIDGEAAGILRKCSVNVQVEVLKKGRLKCALSTPGAAVMARIKHPRRQCTAL